MIDTSIAHYTITDKIGQGGMGEVYRATDTKLNRDVALKVLPEAFAQDKHRMARFAREAQVLASLNHPNIASIYGLEEADGKQAIVLELVEGKDLAERIKRGAIPLEESLKIALQIAEALEAAHEKGIIHRDLKPANVKITPDGVVKVLDFGLAKAMEEEVVPEDISQSPTISQLATKAGIILGTAAYMSPEQARGKPVDKRTDIWAFGVVLYEMLTGKMAFQGEDISLTLAAVMKEDPEWDALSQDIPGRTKDLLRRCLVKDPHDRLHDIADARIELSYALTSPAVGAEVIAPVARPWGWRSTMALFLGCALVFAVGAGAMWMLMREAPSSFPIARFSIEVGPDHSIPDRLGMIALAIAPDGSRVAYVASDDSSSQLYLRMLNELEPRAIPGTEGATSPFFSPNGQWLGFFANRELKKVSMSGGAPQVVSAAPLNPMGASWGGDDNIIFSGGVGLGLFRVSAEAGTPQPLTSPTADEAQHMWPEILPGGRGVLFSHNSRDGLQLAVLSLETGRWRTLVQTSGPGRYVPTGHVMYTDLGDLWAMPFDLARLRRSGSPVPIVEGLYTAMFGVERFAPFAISSAGLFAYPSAVNRMGLIWVSRETGLVEREMSRGLPEGGYPRLSPDGKELSIFRDEGQTWIYDLGTRLGRPVTDSVFNIVSAWTPDGKRLATGSHSSGSVNLTWRAADGSDESETLLERPNRQYPASWFDQQTLVFYEVHPETGGDIWTLRLEGEASVEPFLNTTNGERSPRLSPDGRWLAYASNESGEYNVYVERFPEGGMKQAISTAGGDEPVWSADGRELFYRQGNHMMAVSVESGSAFTVGAAQPLFEGRYGRTPCCGAAYDVSSDGQYFLMIPLNQSEQINVVLNWFEELKRLVPTNN